VYFVRFVYGSLLRDEEVVGVFVRFRAPLRKIWPK
jgi:hypothetical protein